MESKQLVIGIDFGTSDSYVAYIGKGAVDVVQNEVSQRKTPTLVGFTDRERLLGDAALSLIKSNVTNTCRNFKHLLGQKLDSPAVAAERFWSTCELVEADDGFTGCSVKYKGEPATFSATATTAMFLTKLKDITEAWCQGEVADAVIGVPSYFSDFQRAALLDAANIAGLNVLRIMNEHTATALEYGYMRTANFDTDKPTTVAFCQMGHAVFSVAIVQFFRGKLVVVCEKSDKVGGRDMDECLVRSFAGQFQKKTGCDVLSNKKALFKLEDAVTKTKKILSANSESSISCECLMDDHDFSSHVDRADFLDMCKPMMKKVSDVLEAAKAASGLAPSAIDSVEMCGGASRVPWVKEMCSKAFGGKELSTTMNADECVARGCAVQAAILSSLYKVREFKVEDTSPFPVSLGWSLPQPTNGEQAEPAERSAVVFPGNSLMNVLKVVTFLRKGPFHLKAAYADEKALFPGTPKELGTYTIELPPQPEPKKVKVRTALTLHGTFVVESAHLVEPEAAEEAAGTSNSTEAPPAGDAPMPDAQGQEGQQSQGAPENGDDAASGKRRSEGQPPGEAKRKQRFRRTELALIRAGTPGLAPDQLQRRKADEERMISEMREVIETNARRNDLEAYILTMRGGIGEGQKYGAYIKDADRPAFESQLEKAEEWLWDHIEEKKEVFIEKLAELKVLGEPMENRFREEGRRPELVAALEEAVAQAKASAQNGGQRLKGIDPSRLKALEQACEDASRWLAEMQAKQAQLPKYEDPVLSGASIEAKLEELQRLADTALELRTEGSSADLLAGQEGQEEAPRDDGGVQTPKADGQPAGMDVD